MMSAEIESGLNEIELFENVRLNDWPLPVPNGFRVVAFDGCSLKPSKAQILDMYQMAESLVRK
jgi:hypothetical protein